MRVDLDENLQLVLSEVYNGIGIKTDAGVYGICQRDGGIEVMLDGQLVFAHYSPSDPTMTELRNENEELRSQLAECGVDVEPTPSSRQWEERV